jgi:hypothetical protein
MDPSAARLELMQSMIERSREAARERRLAAALRQAALRLVGSEGRDPFTLVVPAQRNGLTAVTPERRHRLRRHIAALLRSTKAAGAVAAAEIAKPAQEPSAVAPKACATCQGRCCGYGGERAYLTEATMARVAASGDRPSPGRILRRYMARVPREAVANSCIFHGAQGCTLDRSLRSDICNNHVCRPLRAYLRRASAPEARDVLIAAVQDGVLHDACLVIAETPP